MNALLGTDIPPVDQYCYLERVGIVTEKKDFPNGPADVIIPSWRGDVEGIADLSEEVARFYGYNKIPTTLMRGQTTLGGYSDEEKLERQLGAVCRSMGYDEIITYSFISPAQYDKIRWAADDARRESFKILNPLGEDTSIMRTTTLPSMLEILTRNYNYRNPSARLYEVGRVYLPGGKDGLAVENKVLSMGAYGDDMDFFTLKGAVEAILRDLRAAGVRFAAPAVPNPSYHPGRCADVSVGGRRIGVMGQIHPLVAQSYGVDGLFYCAELDFSLLLEVKGPDPEYTPLPRFPRRGPGHRRGVRRGGDGRRPGGRHPPGGQGPSQGGPPLRHLPGQGHPGGQKVRGLQPGPPLGRAQLDGGRGGRGREEHPGDPGEGTGRRAAVAPPPPLRSPRSRVQAFRPRRTLPQGQFTCPEDANALGAPMDVSIHGERRTRT